MSDLDQLRDLITELAVVHGRVTLSSGLEADYYIDLRRITLHGTAAPLVGRVLRDLTADWDYDAVGGLTLGADPVATAVMHAADGGARRLRRAQGREEARHAATHRGPLGDRPAGVGRRGRHHHRLRARWLRSRPPARRGPRWSASPSSSTGAAWRRSRLPGCRAGPRSPWPTSVWPDPLSVAADRTGVGPDATPDVASEATPTRRLT